jgi:hypothetical protein
MLVLVSTRASRLSAEISMNLPSRWFVNHEATNLYGLEALNATCDAVPSSLPVQYRPVAFWFFTYETSPPSTSIAFCAPTIELWDVRVEVDITTRNVTSLTQVRQISNSSSEPLAAFAGNLTGAPLRGRAYNGVAFDPDDSALGDPFVSGRAEAIELLLPATVFQRAGQSEDGLVGSFKTQSYVEYSTEIYVSLYIVSMAEYVADILHLQQKYLTLFAQTVYFLPTTTDLTIQLESVQLRLWLRFELLSCFYEVSVSDSDKLA